MPTYQENSERKYFPAVIGGLIVIAIAIASFIISILKQNDANIAPFVFDQVDGTMYVNPGGGFVPNGEPHVDDPANPPE